MISKYHLNVSENLDLIDYAKKITLDLCSVHLIKIV